MKPVALLSGCLLCRMRHSVQLSQQPSRRQKRAWAMKPLMSEAPVEMLELCKGYFAACSCSTVQAVHRKFELHMIKCEDAHAAASQQRSPLCRC